ncbi:hypothetical protein BJ878DRAFT_466366 [Calycina marina]|uniref:Gastric mucin-like protein n=1 Tax=Calycina marina TaxID=1763456 RepID=A0A9P7YXH1_9HELO|nr:hypothetical protein BJ878DRAFT_466366 [Calycina marina]
MSSFSETRDESDHGVESGSIQCARDLDKTGTLISLEGDAQLISTQLRLLPPCQNILILPSFLEDLRMPDDVDARSYVRNVHAASVERLNIAKLFLKSSTASRPRLAFMNGGCATAQLICISHICDNYTNGNLEEAQLVFADIVKDGVLGLKDKEDEHVLENDNASVRTIRGDCIDEVHQEDHTSKAMRAAELLDRRTAELQDTPRVFTPINGRDSIIEYPVCKFNLDLNGGNSRKYLSQPNNLKLEEATFNDQASINIVNSVAAVPSSGAIGKLDCLDVRYTLDDKAMTPNFGRCSELPRAEDNVEYREQQNSSMSVSSTPRTAVFGEARIVDIQSTSPHASPALRKVVSVDRFAAIDSGQRKPAGMEVLRHSRSELPLRYKPTPLQNIPTYSDVPRFSKTTGLKPSEVFIYRRNHTICSSLPPTPNTATSYVDKGTDAGTDSMPTEYSEALEEDSLFVEPVFPLVEDFNIHFTEEHANDLLTTIISAYKRDIRLESVEKSARTAPLSTPTSEISTKIEVSMDTHNSSAFSPGCESSEDDEFDPYSSRNSGNWPIVYRPEVMKSSVSSEQTATNLPIDEDSHIFHRIFLPKTGNVIEIQDGFRALLNSKFAIGKDEDYGSSLRLVLPITSRVWKPLFCEPKTPETKTVDRIIAIGSEAGVKQDFSFLISGQVERLGMKRDGSNRSGRLDLRYLIGNVMQVLSNLPLQPAPYDLFENPTLLAAYLVPHLEAYLATNNSVRLLVLLYPADHLATVTALRALLGSKLFKIAGIVDSSSCDPSSPRNSSRPQQLTNNIPIFPEPPSPRRLRSRTNSSFAINQISPSFPKTPQPPSRAIAFSKADYLLPSCATDSEIVAFLSAIWTSLMKQSTYYTPEPEPPSIIIENIIERYIDRPTLPPSFSNPSRPTTTARSSSAKLVRLTGSHDSLTNASRPEKKIYPASVASTTMTMRTVTSRKRREREDGGDGGENFYVGEEDSEEDDYDRMVLGRAGARPVGRARVGGKGTGTGTASKKKALRWLGLA